jgi:thiamine pyrophosphokinase
LAEAGGETLVVAADSGLLLAEAAGIRPGWILGDMDSLGEAGGTARLESYPPGRVLRHPPEKDLTDTELALLFLRDRGCGEIWLIGGGGGRGDHFLGIYLLFEREQPPDRWISGGEDMFCLREGGELGRALPPGSLVSVFPLGEGPWEAASRSLRWPLDGLTWRRAYYGISNRTLGDSFSIRALRGRFLIILPGAGA